MFEILLILLCALFVLSSLNAMRTTHSIRIFEELDPPRPVSLPRLSIIVTACNEAETIREALTTLAHQDYPDFEILAVDDRSQDRTGEIIEELAGADPKIVPIHIQALPGGWLGKVHALHQAARVATGEWILFTDADVHFAPTALRRAVAHVIGRGKDHFAVLPRVPRQRSFWLNVAVSAFGGLFLLQIRVANLESPNGKAFVGSGGFNLARRAALERTPGFEWLKMEVADDVGLGLMLKNHGFSSTFALSTRDISVAWYRSLGDMARGLEKNSFLALAKGSVPRLIALVAFLTAYLSAPLVAVFATDSPYIAGLGVLAMLSFVAAVLYSERRFKVGLVPSLLMPVGLMLLVAMTIRAAAKCLWQKGVYWRGTFYPLDELKQGQRVRL